MRIRQVRIDWLLCKRLIEDLEVYLGLTVSNWHDCIKICALFASSRSQEILWIELVMKSCLQLLKSDELVD